LGQPRDLDWERRRRVARVQRLQGHPEVALEMVEALHDDLEAAGAMDSPVADAVESSRAGLLANGGHYREGEAAMQALITRIEGRLGQDHPALVVPLTNLAGLYAQRGDLDAARAVHRRLIPLAERWLGPRHPETAVVYESAGIIHYHAGEFAEARRDLERAIASYRHNFDETNPALLRAQGNLAAILIEMHEYEAAEQILLRSRDALVARFGEDHDYLMFIHNNLAELYIAEDRPEAALDAIAWSLRLAESKLGPDSERAGECRGLEGHALAKLGRFEEARSSFERALEIFERAYAMSPKDPDIEASLHYTRLQAGDPKSGDASTTIARLGKLLTDAPNCAKAHYYKALIHLRLDEMPQAKAGFLEAFRLDQRNIDAQRQLRAIGLKEREAAGKLGGDGGGGKKGEDKKRGFGLRDLFKK
ncbi:MAG: tetratricopeptide repeat protein, partial [Myxococcales bacterium]|nr:tetratricopeptide repeat protein [Myxococcales bacterium]